MVVGLLFGMDVETNISNQYQSQTSYSEQHTEQTTINQGWNYAPTDIYSPTIVYNSPYADVEAGSTLKQDWDTRLEASQESTPTHNPILSAEQTAEQGGGGGMMELLIVGALIVGGLFVFMKMKGKGKK